MYAGRCLKTRIPTRACGMRAFRRDAYMLLPYFDHMHRYLPALMMSEGLRVEERKSGIAPGSMAGRITPILAVWRWLSRTCAASCGYANGGGRRAAWTKSDGPVILGLGRPKGRRAFNWTAKSLPVYGSTPWNDGRNVPGGAGHRRDHPCALSSGFSRWLLFQLSSTT